MTQTCLNFEYAYSLSSAENLLFPWKLCHNSPNPSFRTSAASRGEIRNPVKVQYNQIISGSRLASRFAGLGRDDESRHSLLGEMGMWLSCGAK